MKTSILCIIFLLFSSAATAEKLYRWVEADGTITFSPQPPPKGIKYSTVESGALSSNNKNVQMLSKMAEQQKPQKNSEASLVAPSNALKRDIAKAPSPTKPVAKLEYAPETSKPFTRDQNTALATTHANAAESVVSQPSNNKPSHCIDLSKRVVSLERRMRAGLSADDMDNTVVAMAHYQRSYDQHCL